MVHMPRYLKRRLTMDEIRHAQDLAEERDTNCITWKFGRSSHFTFGILSKIITIGCVVVGTNSW
jgi:hypothetical protein